MGLEFKGSQDLVASMLRSLLLKVPKDYKYHKCSQLH